MPKSLIIAGLVVVAALLVFKMQSASASPFSAQTSPCANCHVAHAQVRLFLNKTSAENGNTTFSYTVIGPYQGAFGFAVFQGETKVAEGFGPVGSFTVATDGVYTAYAVNKDPNSLAGFAVLSLSPAESP